MDNNELIACLEAVLFAAGEPVELSKLSVCTGTEQEETAAALSQLQTELNERNSGICLLELDGKYQLCTKKQYAGYIRELLETKKNAPLSAAALEVLAVVAYNQPVTKSFVEQVRGVDCSGVMATLVKRSLIEERGRLDLPGHPLLYGTTPGFLRCFCVSSLEELPVLSENEEKNVPENENSVKSEEDFAEKVDESKILM